MIVIALRNIYATGQNKKTESEISQNQFNKEIKRLEEIRNEKKLTDKFKEEIEAQIMSNFQSLLEKVLILKSAEEISFKRSVNVKKFLVNFRTCFSWLSTETLIPITFDLIEEYKPEIIESLRSIAKQIKLPEEKGGLDLKDVLFNESFYDNFSSDMEKRVNHIFEFSLPKDSPEEKFDIVLYIRQFENYIKKNSHGLSNGATELLLLALQDIALPRERLKEASRPDLTTRISALPEMDQEILNSKVTEIYDHFKNTAALKDFLEKEKKEVESFIDIYSVSRDDRKFFCPETIFEEYSEEYSHDLSNGATELLLLVLQNSHLPEERFKEILPKERLKEIDKPNLTAEILALPEMEQETLDSRLTKVYDHFKNTVASEDLEREKREVENFINVHFVDKDGKRFFCPETVFRIPLTSVQRAKYKASCILLLDSCIRTLPSYSRNHRKVEDPEKRKIDENLSKRLQNLEILELIRLTIETQNSLRTPELESLILSPEEKNVREANYKDHQHEQIDEKITKIKNTISNLEQYLRETKMRKKQTEEKKTEVDEIKDHIERIKNPSIGLANAVKNAVKNLFSLFSSTNESQEKKDVLEDRIHKIGATLEVNRTQEEQNQLKRAIAEVAERRKELDSLEVKLRDRSQEYERLKKRDEEEVEQINRADKELKDEETNLRNLREKKCKVDAATTASQKAIVEKWKEDNLKPFVKKVFNFLRIEVGESGNLDKVKFPVEYLMSLVSSPNSSKEDNNSKKSKNIIRDNPNKWNDDLERWNQEFENAVDKVFGFIKDANKSIVLETFLLLVRSFKNNIFIIATIFLKYQKQLMLLFQSMSIFFNFMPTQQNNSKRFLDIVTRKLKGPTAKMSEGQMKQIQDESENKIVEAVENMEEMMSSQVVKGNTLFPCVLRDLHYLKSMSTQSMILTFLTNFVSVQELNKQGIIFAGKKGKRDFVSCPPRPLLVNTLLSLYKTQEDVEKDGKNKFKPSTDEEKEFYKDELECTFNSLTEWIVENSGSPIFNSAAHFIVQRLSISSSLRDFCFLLLLNVNKILKSHEENQSTDIEDLLRGICDFLPEKVDESSEDSQSNKKKNPLDSLLTAYIVSIVLYGVYFLVSEDFQKRMNKTDEDDSLNVSDEKSGFFSSSFSSRL